MTLLYRRVAESVGLVTCVVLLMTGLAFAQATSTFNGRVLDQGDAVLPGVTVTATNVNTGVVRTTVTNAEGIYFMPGLDPGVYEVKTELAGFATTAQDRVTLAVNSTITIDFTMRLAGVQEALTVTGEAPLIEVTQSKVASSIEATELENLPMITRTVSGMLALLPGAVQIAPHHRSKENVGSVSYGGGSGTNVIPTVDGADNRDNQYGGPLMTFTTEGLEQFQLATSQFTATDGRSAGAALTILTKSGTNIFHGSGFLFARDEALNATDFFTKQAGAEKVPFSRQQFGGSLGGPVMRNRLFFFGAAEQVYEDTSIPVPDSLFNQHEMLVRAVNAGQVPEGLVYRDHPRAGAIPMNLLMYTLKSNAQLTNSQSLMARFAGQRDNRDAVVFQSNNDMREPEMSRIAMWSAVGQHSWVLGNQGLNQITAQVNHLSRISDVTSNITGQHYTTSFPNVPIFPPRLSFPSVNTGAGGGAGTITDTYVIQLKDDVSLQKGTHGLRFGVNFNYLPDIGLLNGNEHFATLTFFDDPSVILSNSNGRYPQGFQTPGIVRQWQQANPVLADSLLNAKQFATWFQDDWRVTPQLTLNLGLRYDLDLNFYDQGNWENNATRLALDAIGSPFSRIPKTPTKDISPRVGFAYDLLGDGRRVLRGGYGLYFDQFNINGGNVSDIFSQNRRPLNVLATLTNTALGVGQLANYRFGIDPVPAQPTESNTLPRGATGQWLNPDIADPYNHTMHVGYAHELAANTMVSVDYTHVEGRRELRTLNINPIVNGQRVLAPDFLRVFGQANYLNDVRILSSGNQSRYDAMTVKLQRRLPRATLQAHYTLAGAYAYGGVSMARGAAPLAQDAFDPLADGEWGPTLSDERHRVVAMGVFELPYGIQLSPIFQAATARPYNLTAGADLNGDGTNNDRFIDPSTGQQVSINAGRGDSTVLMDLRTTKFLELGGDRRLGLFAEVFNVFNTVNFGGQYNGNGRSAVFRQPNAYVPGIGYARQLQLGARFLF
jgi:Carboxypeptidase regulatory-like domain/TonB dependent receptor